jgi:hypothetical protein
MVEKEEEKYGKSLIEIFLFSCTTQIHTQKTPPIILPQKMNKIKP